MSLINSLKTQFGYSSLDWWYELPRRFLGVMIAMLFWCKKYQKTWFQTLDFIAPCVPTGLMFGRFGNLLVESYMVVRLQIRTIHLE